ncbi:MAG TPA: low affinity iron permease family protein [Candidatus Saccharimonadales bacterium]|jgi:low affinity Fe/Cu permease|nr:low affinity iron permease family protein [Candidatus Saccharimonadales bacterium]
MNEVFHKLAVRVSIIVGSPKAFFLSVFIIILWGISGPIFHYSDTWQLIINTATTIVTFLMVFLIQNTQNRDAKAIHLKLDELIKTGRGSNDLVDLEDFTDAELDAFQKQFRDLHEIVKAKRDKLAAKRANLPK